MTTKLSLENSVLILTANVLGQADRKISLGDSFTSLGGHSIDAANMAAALQAAYPSLKITALDILRCPSTGALVDFIRTQGIR